MSSSRKITIGIALLLAVSAGAAWLYAGWSPQERKTSDPILSITPTNAYLQRYFGFTFGEVSSSDVPIVLVCSEKAPKNPAETPLGQFTYCQNNGAPLKIGLAWKNVNMVPVTYFTLVANAVMKDIKNESGNFSCVEDKSPSAKGSFPGVLSDCKITTSDGAFYYFSTFLFYPPTHPEISQVLYVYDRKNPSDESAVRAMVRNLAGGITF